MLCIVIADGICYHHRYGPLTSLEGNSGSQEERDGLPFPFFQREPSG